MEELDLMTLIATGRFAGLREYPGYGVSDDGRIWSCWNSSGPGKGKKLKPDWWYPMKLAVTCGYKSVLLKKGNGFFRTLVHRAVLETFVGQCPDGMECRHLDGNRNNNHVSNLAWGTRAQNVADQRDHGTDRVGERNGRAKLNEQDVRDIFAMRRLGTKLKDIASSKGVSLPLVNKILAGILWKHVGRP